MVFLAALILILSVLAKRLAGKNISNMTYLVLNGTLNLNLNQSITDDYWHCIATVCIL